MCELYANSTTCLWKISCQLVNILSFSIPSSPSPSPHPPHHPLVPSPSPRPPHHPLTPLIISSSPSPRSPHHPLVPLTISSSPSPFLGQLEGTGCWSIRTVLLYMATGDDLSHFLQLGDYYLQVCACNINKPNRVEMVCWQMLPIC